MSARENHISYSTQGRFYTHGDPQNATKLIIALHGYGQLAPYFIRKFQHLNPDEYYVVCPEGPHRFYLKGTAGRVGASWMTKEDRKVDIENQYAFLDQLAGEHLANYSFDERTLIGFSQGGATASRWVVKTPLSFDRFVLWAAVFPPDMPIRQLDRFQKMKCHFVVGNADEYISPERAQEMLETLSHKDLPFEMFTFEGTHTIDSHALNALLS